MALKDNPDGLPIIGANSPTNQAIGLFSSSLYAKEAVKILENGTVFDNLVKINELRKSCGVEPSKTTITIRRPARYGDTL
jgi:hypothetical protein